MNKTIGLAQLKTRLEGCFVVTDSTVFSLFKDFLPADTFVLDPAVFGGGSLFSGGEFSGSESLKCFAAAQVLIGELLKRGAGKSVTLAAVGGGAVGDLVGFVAAIFMRGVSWICVPTTVTAFADSSIGGKTALNVGAKNSVGAFILPKTAYFCPEFLQTLPQNLVTDGLAEVYKTALLDKKLFELVSDLPAADRVVATDLDMILSRCGAVKQRIVGKDFFDRGIRRALNMGHTVGHAVEKVCGLSHGRAVMVGLLAENFIFGKCDRQVTEFLRKVCLPYFDGLFCKTWDKNAITNAAINDKKNDGRIVIAAAKKVGKCEFFSVSPTEFCHALGQFFDSVFLVKSATNSAKTKDFDIL